MIPRRARAPLAVGAAVLASTVVVALVDPNEPGHYPLCPTKYLLGLDCPGCGGLRAVHALATGDVVGAVDHNAFVVLLLLPFAVILWLAWLRRSWTDDDPEAATGTAAGGGGLLQRAADALVARPVIVGGVVAMLVFTVVRNVEAVPLLGWLGSAAAV